MRICPSCGEQSPERMRFCTVCGASLSQVVARESRRTVTIVFAMPKVHSLAGEAAGPETMRDVMSRYFDGMREALERHGGTVEKFIGDAVMAVFGLPVRHEDDAVRAIRAAADMQAALERLNPEFRADCRAGAEQPHRREQRRGHRRRREHRAAHGHRRRGQHGGAARAGRRAAARSCSAT